MFGHGWFFKATSAWKKALTEFSNLQIVYPNSKNTAQATFGYLPLDRALQI